MKSSKNYKTSISRQGYSLVKSKFSDAEIQKIRKSLTVRPYINSRIGEPARPFPVYVENEVKIYLPRYFAWKKYGPPEINKLHDGTPISLEFSGNMRPRQKPIIKAYMAAAKDTGGGIISVGCGEGKTVVALKIISLLKVKTLVVVHKEFLMNQWKDRILGDSIKQMPGFLPEARVGIIQGSNIDIKDKDIVIGMLQSISMKDYPLKIFSEFGLVIYDECHHVSAEIFSRALLKTCCKYTLGLSATPNRKDGLRKVFEWYLGDIIYKSQNNRNDDVNVKIYDYKYDDRSYNSEVINYVGKLNTAKMINNICECHKRNTFIINTIKELAKENRQILILSDRKKQLHYLNDTITSQGFATSGLYVGGMKEIALKDSETKDIMLGTYAMVSEGFDCPKLDTLIFASPKSSIEQSVGRILRKKPEDRVRIPVIIDIWDKFSMFKRQGMVRQKYYKKRNYNVSSFTVNDNVEPTNIVENQVSNSSNNKNRKGKGGNNGKKKNRIYKFINIK